MKQNRLILKNFVIISSVSIVLNLRACQLGIENIGSSLERFKHASIALVANQCSRAQDGTPTLALLQRQGFNISTILAPEHGFSGTTVAGKTVHDEIEQHTHIPIKSLYRQATHTTPPDLLATIDALFFDLPHCGMRHYTYISTLYKLLELAAQQQIPIVVFDRPNPLGPLMEGPLVDPSQSSFISIAPIPLRYGLSIGELALYFNNQMLSQPAQLIVVPMAHYQRTKKERLLQAPLSPNIPNLSSCYGYSFLGLLEEISPFFAGNNTKKPFRYILLPKHIKLSQHKWHIISTILSRYHIMSKPTRVYRNKNKMWYNGLYLTFLDIHATRSFSLLLDLLCTFKQFGVPYTLSTSFDKAIGTNRVRKFLDGSCSYNIMRTIHNDLKNFYSQARPFFLYTPYPIISTIKPQVPAGSITYAKRYERSHAAKKSSIA